MQANTVPPKLSAEEVARRQAMLADIRTFNSAAQLKKCETDDRSGPFIKGDCVALGACCRRLYGIVRSEMPPLALATSVYCCLLAYHFRSAFVGLPFRFSLRVARYAMLTVLHAIYSLADWANLSFAVPTTLFSTRY